MTAPLEPHDFFTLLSALLAERRAATKAKGRISFAVEDAGAFVLDLEQPTAIGRRFDDAADTLVVCNRRGLDALTEGHLSKAHGDDGPLLLWSGSSAPLLAIAKALGGNRSVFNTRIAAMKGAL